MSDTARWSQVDDYIAALFFPPDVALEAGVVRSRSAGLPEIAVTPPLGRLLEMLVRLRRAQRVLEVGTLGGYSTTWLTRGLQPGGRVVTLELSAHHAEVARANLADAGLADRVDVCVGPAAESLAELRRQGAGPFDLVFIDADKVGYPAYWEHAIALSAPGTLIVADNTVREGAVVDPASPDANVQGVRAFHALVAKEPRVQATTIQMVGSKGYDGVTLALVIA